MSTEVANPFSMPLHTPAAARESDDDIIATAHGMRKSIVSYITKGGTALPIQDRAQMDSLFKAIDGMDRQAITNKRIKVEEAANKTQEEAARDIAALLQKVTSQKPFEVVDVEARSVRDAPQLPAEVPAPVLLEGETSTAAVQQNYDSFVAQTSPNE